MHQIKNGTFQRDKSPKGERKPFVAWVSKYRTLQNGLLVNDLYHYPHSSWLFIVAIRCDHLLLWTHMCAITSRLALFFSHVWRSSSLFIMFRACPWLLLIKQLVWSLHIHVRAMRNRVWWNRVLRIRADILRTAILNATSSAIFEPL